MLVNPELIEIIRIMQCLCMKFSDVEKGKVSRPLSGTFFIELSCVILVEMGVRPHTHVVPQGLTLH